MVLIFRKTEPQRALRKAVKYAKKSDGGVRAN
jgi:hypothetical protein